MTKSNAFQFEIAISTETVLAASVLQKSNDIQPTWELYEIVQGKIEIGAEAELFATSRQLLGLLEQSSGYYCCYLGNI